MAKSVKLPEWLYEQAEFFAAIQAPHSEKEFEKAFNTFVDEAIEHSLVPHMGDE